MRDSSFSERGLTIVEIMVVLIILGVVMAMIGGRILGQGDRLKAKATELKIKDIGQSIEQFRLQYNSLPNGIDDLTKCTEKTGPGCIPITKPEALTDAWGNQLIYSLENNGRSYRLKSLGADGREGGEGVDFDLFGTGP